MKCYKPSYRKASEPELTKWTPEVFLLRRRNCAATSRVTLAPGERREIEFEITDADLSFSGKDFQPIVEPGEFIAMVGTSSADVQAVAFTRLTA